jgi:hypothetical protein
MANKVISDIVKKTLNERYELNNSLRLIIENEESSDDEKLDNVLTALSNLGDQGMSDGEIETNIDEGVGDWLKRVFIPGADNSSDSEGINKGVGDFSSKVSSGWMSQLREWLITKGLSLIGFKGRLAGAIAAGMADLSISTIIALFRGGNNCEKHAPKVVDAVAEGLVAYIAEDTDDSSAIGASIRNIGAEYFRASNLGEMIADSICNLNIKKSLNLDK